MSLHYDIINDFVGLPQGIDANNVDSSSLDPYWVLTIVRFKYPILFSRDNLLKPNSKFSNDQIVDYKGSIIITSDCVNLQIHNTKDNHIMTLNAVLMPGNIEYQNEVFPGDWILANIVYGKDKQNELIGKIKKGEAINGFDDGFKFIGRVASINKNLVQNPNGIRTVRYTIQAQGFKEFDSTFYYEPTLALNYPDIPQYLKDLSSIAVNSIIDPNKAGIDINKIYPLMIHLLFGTGIKDRLATVQDSSRFTGATVQLDDLPYAYVLPSIVSSLLGQTQTIKTNGFASIEDILQTLIGGQKYEDLADVQLSGSDKARVLRPTDRYDMIGIFNVTDFQLTDKSVWTLLNQYLNPFINEIYTCLKPDDKGSILPTLVVRQQPFSTRFPLSDNNSDVPTTTFYEIPKWKMHNSLVKSLETVRSDAFRVNFFHIFGQFLADIPGTSAPEQFQRSGGAISDTLDIKRNGLRPRIGTVASGLPPNSNALDQSQKWMMLHADFFLGYYMSLSGTLNSYGIQAPICVGDNLEIDDTLYHIEATLHQCGISPNGNKSFTSTLILSRGLRSEDSKNKAQELIDSQNNLIDDPKIQIPSDLSLYPGTDNQSIDNTRFEPGYSSESVDDLKTTSQEQEQAKFSKKIENSNDIKPVNGLT